MYKYYKELENPNDFYICLTNYKYENEKTIYNIKPNIESLKNYKNLLSQIKVINDLINSFNFECDSNGKDYDTYAKMRRFDKYIDMYRSTDSYCYLFNIDNIDLYEVIDFYLNCTCYLIDIFPIYKEKLINIKNTLKEYSKELSNKRNIKLEYDKYIRYYLPNAFYITPDGFLYNSGGEDGHKEGNFKYPYQKIYETLKMNRKVTNPYLGDNEIELVEHRSFITEGQLKGYMNLIYRIMTIDTPEVIKANQRRKTYFEFNNDINYKTYEDSYLDFLKINGMDGLLEDKRTYQKNIVNAYLGYLHAEKYFYNGMTKFNESNQKTYIGELLKSYDMSDIMVQFLGFHKIESSLNKTITTSTLNIELFEEYIKKGWNIHIIPKLIYDKYQDNLVYQNLNSYFLKDKIEEIEHNYKDKVKILK